LDEGVREAEKSVSLKESGPKASDTLKQSFHACFSMEITTDILLGDCKEVLKTLPDDSVDLIFTSPPYADQRKKTYGGIHPDDYVEWFLPIAAELKRVLKPSGTFILNIKEKVVNGERSRMKRNSIGIEIMPEYHEMVENELRPVVVLFA
jgi:DNA modification methylase